MHVSSVNRVHYMIAALVILCCVSTGATQAINLDESVLTVASYSEGDLLTPFSKECWLLARGLDFAVMLKPADFHPTEAEYHSFDAIRNEGAYYLYLSADAWLTEFEGNTEVLWREGRTTLLWTSEDFPQMTTEAIETLPGMRQPILLTMTPKPWPIAHEADQRSRTEFHPLAAQMVSEITLPPYVDIWQDLDDYETRYYNTSENEACSQWMLELLQSYGLEAEYHYYQQSGTRRNVVATITGLVNPNNVVYLTGHFDSISQDPQNHAPGADDNGSGTAAVLEAARIMSQYNFQNTIKFVLFNGEEEGLYGSTAFVSDIPGIVNVLGCYNYDMISYAGSDPLPPDLIIYTNTLSLSFAQVLADACTEFVPNGVEPVILNESMGSSDHGPFWNAGLKAICGIEAAPWTEEFCPWYHTPDDQIERYPQDYPTHCTMALVGAAAQIAIPMQPDTPFLSIEAITIDDDNTGASSGNGNGILEYGETVELIVTLENMGLATATGVTGDLAITDEYLTMITGSAGFGSISGGGSGSNSTPFVFSVSALVPDGHEFACNLAISEDPENLAFTLNASAPAVAVIAYEIDDVAGGDGDGIAEAGEVVQMTLTIENSGSVGVDNLVGTLSGGAYLTINDAPIAFGLLGPGDSQVAEARSVTISAGAPELFSSIVTLNLNNGAFFDRQEIFTFNIGDIFTSSFENGSPGWSHAAGSDGYTDQWHLEDYRNHTSGGDTSWKCGGSNGSDYGDMLHAELESTPFILPPDSELFFWHWISAETSGNYPGYCYDGGRIEISIDGGTWEPLTPAGGYPYLVRDGQNPFPGETPLFSGSHGWQRETIDLAAYSGTARIRFAFGSDSNTTEEGWYIDDVVLVLTGVAGTDDHVENQALSFRSTSGNPTPGNAVLKLDLPRSESAMVGIFDASGRCIRLLVNRELSAGNHTLTWDGRSDDGVLCGTGVFWARARVGTRSLSTRLLVLR